MSKPSLCPCDICLFVGNEWHYMRVGRWRESVIKSGQKEEMHQWILKRQLGELMHKRSTRPDISAALLSVKDVMLNNSTCRFYLFTYFHLNPYLYTTLEGGKGKNNISDP